MAGLGQLNRGDAQSGKGRLWTDFGHGARLEGI